MRREPIAPTHITDNYPPQKSDYKGAAIVESTVTELPPEPLGTPDPIKKSSTWSSSPAPIYTPNVPLASKKVHQPIKRSSSPGPRSRANSLSSISPSPAPVSRPAAPLASNKPNNPVKSSASPGPRSSTNSSSAVSSPPAPTYTPTSLVVSKDVYRPVKASSSPPPATVSHYNPPVQNPSVTDCPVCGSPNEHRHVQEKAGSLNTGRPWRYCSNQGCGRFNGFADDRGLQGVRGANQLCDCPVPNSVRLVAKNKQDHQGRREAFYSCQFKACQFWANHERGGWEGDVVYDG